MQQTTYFVHVNLIFKEPTPISERTAMTLNCMSPTYRDGMPMGKPPKCVANKCPLWRRVVGDDRLPSTRKMGFCGLPHVAVDDIRKNLRRIFEDQLSG